MESAWKVHGQCCFLMVSQPYRLGIWPVFSSQWFVYSSLQVCTLVQRVHDTRLTILRGRATRPRSPSAISSAGRSKVSRRSAIRLLWCRWMDWSPLLARKGYAWYFSSSNGYHFAASDTRPLHHSTYYYQRRPPSRVPYFDRLQTRL